MSKRIKSRRYKKDQPVKDKTLTGLILTFLLFGILVIYNSTTIYSQDTFGGAYRFVFLQIGWVSIGLICYFIISKIDYHKVVKVTLPLMLFVLVCLLLLALTSIFATCGSDKILFAPCINGAHRWLYLNPPPLMELPLIGVLGFQPGELTKLAVIIYLAVILDKNIKRKSSIFGVFMITVGIVSGLILLQPNMSTAALLMLIGIVMYFMTNQSLKPLYFLLPVLTIVGVAFIIFSGYRKERLDTFINIGGEELGYHMKQILISLGTGGTFGVGFGQSKQKFQYLPEVASDSIFAIIGEEFGFVGTTIFVLAFSFFIYKGFQIAKNSPDMFGRLLAAGVTTWMAVQFFVNVAAMIRLIPLTGIPLPLVSYGGSATVFSLIGLGLLSSVSNNS